MTVTAKTHGPAQKAPFRRQPAAPASIPETQAVTTQTKTIHQIDPAHRAQADDRAEARIAEVLRTAESIRDHTRSVYASVTDGVIRLFGAVRHGEAAREIEIAVRTISRTDAIENEIRVIGARCGD